VDEALALAAETGEDWTDSFLHRIRGGILLKRDPANTGPAEAAFLTAIAVAHQQKAKSFGLRAALSLAKLYQSTGRAADAHAVLAPALEGFSPTPELPEIDEAQSLFATLAETDEVKNAAAARQRRLKLQTDYGKALIWAKGYTAPEATAAFNRARERAAGIDNAGERFATYYGHWAGMAMRGELVLARQAAAAFIREAENGGRTPEAAAGQRILGLTCLYQGDFTNAQLHLIETLKIYDPRWDRDSKLRFSVDTGASTVAYLARVNWALGDVGGASKLITEAVARAVELAHIATLTNTHYFKALFEIVRGDPAAARRDAEIIIDLSQQRDLATYVGLGTMSRGWARARLGERENGIAELRDGLSAFIQQGNKTFVPFFQGLLAEIEADEEGAEGDLTRLDEALALAGQTGEHWSDALLHRIRGEILFKRDPANTGPAEEAFLAAIAIAQQQKAKSFELRAALSLAKLYQSSGRAAEAHAVLAPALEGFSPTSEFPEIQQAQTLLAALT